MWYGPSEIPLQLTLRPSLKLRLWIAVNTGLALVAIQYTALPILLKLVLYWLCGWYAFDSLRRVGGAWFCRKSPKAVTELYWDGAEQWRLRRQTGEWLDASLQPNGWSHPRLVVLKFRLQKDSWHRCVVLLTDDNCDPDGLRSLRARLRWLNLESAGDRIT